MENIEQKFYKEIKSAINGYVDKFEQAIKAKDDMLWSGCQKDYELLNEKLSDEQIEALKNILAEACTNVVHSLFVSIDGGTALSNEGKVLDLVDYNTKKPITEGALHENFMSIFD